MQTVSTFSKLMIGFVLGAVVAGGVAVAVTPDIPPTKVCVDNRTKALYAAIDGSCSRTRTLMTVVGNSVDVQTIASRFGDIPNTTDPIVRNRFLPEQKIYGSHRVVDDAVPMPAVFLAAHAQGFAQSELLDLEILSTIIGTGTSSILYRELVSNTRIASMAGAFVDRRANASLFTMYAYAAEPSVSADQIVQAIHTALRSVDITQRHLDAAINKLRTGHAAELQKVNGVADSVAWTTLFWNDPERMNTILDDYRNVKLEQIIELRDSLMSEERMLRLDIVPRSADAT